LLNPASGSRLNPGHQATTPEDPTMRFIHLYLIGYFVLVVGAVAALYQSGVLAHVSGVWIGIGVLIALGLGIMLAVSAGKPTVTEEKG
jgi:hypothetical protein